MIALTVTLAAAQAAAPVFAPPSDRPITITLETVRSATGLPDRSFRSERSVRFERDGAGWKAVLRIVESNGGATGAGQLFEAGFAALKGRDLVFRLDAGGRIESVDDAAALWDALTNAVSTAAQARNALAAQGVVDLMRRLPPDRQLAMLASLLTPALARPEESIERPEATPVTLPGSTIGGAAQSLAGTRRVTRDGSAFRTVIEASGTGSRNARVRYTLERRSEAATGLVRDSVETIETTLPEPGDPMVRAVTRTRITL